MSIRLVYFSSDSFFTGILDSQVLLPLRLLGESVPGIERGALFLTSLRQFGTRAIKDREKQVLQALPGAKVHFKYRLNGLLPLQNRLWAGQLRRSIRRFGFTGDAPIIVHCRGEHTAAAAGLLKRRDRRIRVLVDIRGAGDDEVKRTGWLGRYLETAIQQRLRDAMHCADAINTVSARMAEHLRRHYALKADLPSSVVACCVDTKRFHFSAADRLARRKDLGLEGRFVVCYSGTMTHWQKPDALAAAFAAIRSGMSDAHLLVLTSQEGMFRPHLQNAGVNERDVTIRYASHDQMASYLMAADMAMLLRDNTLTNQVASPVKFAEYVRCGLPVMLTPHIGDFSTLVGQADLGRTIELPLDPAEVLETARTIRKRLEADGDYYRQRSSRIAQEQLSWDGQLDKLVRIYQTLSAAT